MSSRSVSPRVVAGVVGAEQLRANACVPQGARAGVGDGAGAGGAVVGPRARARRAPQAPRRAALEPP